MARRELFCHLQEGLEDRDAVRIRSVLDWGAWGCFCGSERISPRIGLVYAGIRAGPLQLCEDWIVELVLIEPIQSCTQHFDQARRGFLFYHVR